MNMFALAYGAAADQSGRSDSKVKFDPWPPPNMSKCKLLNSESP